MSDKHIDALGEFDALLRKEMSIEPGSAFLPRVRERISAQPAPTLRHWRGWLAAVSAAAAGVAAAVVIGTGAPSTRPPDAPAAPQLRIGQAIPWLAAPEAVAPVVSQSTAPQRTGLRADAATAPSHAEPVVIVDQHQQMALATVMRLVLEGRLTGKSFEKTIPASMLPIREQVPSIDVKPVLPSPIAGGGVLQ